MGMDQSGNIGGANQNGNTNQMGMDQNMQQNMNQNQPQSMDPNMNQNQPQSTDPNMNPSSGAPTTNTGPPPDTKNVMLAFLDHQLDVTKIPNKDCHGLSTFFSTSSTSTSI
jgi:hypothetical protein